MSEILIKVNGEISVRDLTRAQFIHLRPRPLFKWLGIFLVLLALGLAVRGVCVSENSSYYPYYIFGGLVYFFLNNVILLPFRCRKTYKQQKSLHGQVEYRIMEDKLEATSPFGQSAFAWKDFVKYKEGRDLILVYFADNLFQMFPKQWFTEDQFASFRGVLQRQMGSPKA